MNKSNSTNITLNHSALEVITNRYKIFPTQKTNDDLMNLFIKINLFVFLIFSFTKSFCQDIPKRGVLFDDLGVKIELGVKVPKNPCDSNASKKAKYCLYVTNEDGLQNLKPFLNWKMQFINCNNQIMEQTISVNISTLKEGQNVNMDWTFDASQVEKYYLDVVNDYTSNTSRIRKISDAISIQPDSIVGTTSILTGESITLRIVGGTLTSDAKWVWYSGTCGNGIREGEGSILKKSSLYKTTNFYVRAEGLRGNTGCASKQVVVDNNSVAADAIMGKSKICKSSINNKIMLYVVGGKKGLDASWVWYKNSCNGFNLGSGDTIYVSPQETTIYYVRAEGPTINPTSCVSLTIEVVSPSIKPEGIKVTQVNECANELVLLEPDKGKLSNDAVWHWRSIMEGSTMFRDEGVSNVLSVYPDYNTTYYLTAEDNICKSTEEIAQIVKVKDISVAPNSILVQKIKKNTYNLSVTGGVLGDNAKWVWYKTTCGGEKLASGENNIEYKAKKEGNLIYVRAEGDCNTTDCVMANEYSIVRSSSTKNKSKNFWYFSGGAVTTDSKKIENGVLSFGCKYVYVSTKFSLLPEPTYSLDQNGILNYPNNNTYYLLSTNTYAKRSAFTGGFMVGGGVFRIYFGGGVGSYQKIQGFDIYDSNDFTLLSKEKALDINSKVSGIEGEAGIFMNLGSIMIHGGVNSVFSQTNGSIMYSDAQLSLGFKL